MFIDIHVHVRLDPGPPRHGQAAWCTPEQLIARYDEVNIERGVLLPISGPEVYVPQSNEEIIGIAERFPDRFIPFCNLHPKAVANAADSDFGPLLDYYKQRGCKGVGEVTANMEILDPMVQNLFRHVEAAGLPLTFHISERVGMSYGLVDRPGLPGLEWSLGRFPKLRFLGHSPGFWSEIARLETPADRTGYAKYPVREEGVLPILFRRYENLYGDLSAGSGCNALTRDPDYAVRFLTEFQDRLLFGTDICAPATPTPLVDFLTGLRNDGKISEEIFNKVARENAVKLLGV